MKRWLTNVTMVLVLLVAALGRPVPVLAVDMPFLRAAFGVGLPDPPDHETTLHWQGTYIGPDYSAAPAFGANLFCEGDECWKIDFYIQYHISVTYSDSYGGPNYTFQWSVLSGSVVKKTDTISCRTTNVRHPSTDTCEVSGYVILPAEMVVNSAHPEAVITFRLNGNLTSADEIYNIDVTISAVPISIDDCEDYEDLVGGGYGGTIDPTSEEGDSVTDLEVGTLYRLTISGGPWVSGHAPTVDRYDTAIKIDDEEWQAIERQKARDNVQCIENSEDGNSFTMVFEAEDPDWAIRVDDIVGQFADNYYSDEGISWTLTRAQLSSGPSGCSGQFLQGNLLGTYTLDAKDSAGERIAVPAAGKWVQVVVQAGTYWQDDGAGDELLTVAIKATSATWYPIETYPFEECSEPDVGLYYFQVATPNAHYLRVADLGANWEANTGSLTVNVYSSTYVPYPSECEAQYKVGDIIETKVIAGNSPVGVTIADGEDLYPPLPSGGERDDTYRYLMMEVINGPFWDGIAYSAATEIYYGPTSTWNNADTFPTATCVVQLDGLGRTRIYFPYESSIQARASATPWKFRPDDTDGVWGNNTGYIGYSLYYVDYLRVDTCEDAYTLEPTGIEITLYGNDEDGSSLGTLQSGDIYAFETSGTWNDGSSSRRDVAFSNNGGTTWEDFHDSTKFVCKSEDEVGNLSGYWQAQLGASYRMRVNDDDGLFGNNSGQIVVTLYRATTNLDPWGSCADQYVLGEEMPVPMEQRTVIATEEGGLQLPLPTGNFYAVEIGQEPYPQGAWTPKVNELTGGPYYRTAQISSGNGLTWTAFEDAIFAQCVVRLPENSESMDRYRIYFEANTTYFVRVADDGGPLGFVDNIGGLTLHYYRIIGDNEDYDELPPWWSTSCYQPCVRPDSLIKIVTVDFGTLGSVPLPVPAVDLWLEYGRCGIQKFLAWCPEHSAMLDALPDYLNDREPFATIRSLRSLISFTLDQVDAAGWGSETESGGEAFTSEEIIPALDEDSPYRGGQITFEPPAMGGEEGATDCYERVLSYYYAHDGSAADRPFYKGWCTAINLINTWEGMFNFGFYAEILLGMLFIMYVRTYFKRLEELF